MKKLIIAVILAASATAAQANNVTDTLTAGQSPVAGDILYYSGINGNTAGTWAQPNSIPGLQGPQGIQGEQGLQGAQGTQGDKGDTGAAGANGNDGANGKDGSNGKDGARGLAGVNGQNLNAPAIDPRMDVEVREYDSRHWSVSSYASFGFQSSTTRYVVGQKLTLKLGKSYEEKQRELLEKRIRKDLESALNNAVLLPN